MAIAHPLRAAALLFQLFAMFAASAVAAQAAPPPIAADPATQTPAPSAPEPDAPLVQLEGPGEHVVAPPPARSPGPAPAAAMPPERELGYAQELQMQPSCDLRATPSPCAQPADAYRHDGFYLRWTNETQYLAFLGSGPDGDASLQGVGAGGMLAIGGTPLPGLVIAGMLGSSMLSGDLSGAPQGQDENASMARAMIGVLADWYPRPDDGWHVGAALGFAGITLTESSISDAVGPAFAAKVFGGYDWWIGPQWSLGLMAVFTATPSTALFDSDGEKNGYRFYTLSAGFAWGLTLH